MKAKVFLLFAFCVLFGYGQNMNHVSADIFLPVFGTAQFQYERGFNKNMTASLSMGGKFSSGIFRVEGIDGNRIMTDDFNFKGFKLIPEFRWYVQKTSTPYYGFYVGAYAKFQRTKDEIKGIYIAEDETQHELQIDAKIRTFGYGLQVGYKLEVYKSFFVDFIIFGPGLTFNTFELKEKVPVPEAFYDDLSEALSNYGIFEQWGADFEINPNGETERIALPALRYGIKVGYSF
ncbi:DUF3575 domain-containing protein [Muricauda sp. CAU 1633]|nr:DUF3575 domain-containing protein [Muricauda sp. CAU 1633]MBO0322279.1 DUF3575 domain-containing protein [Muricauda sp. CAU 1633]